MPKNQTQLFSSTMAYVELQSADDKKRGLLDHPPSITQSVDESPRASQLSEGEGEVSSFRTLYCLILLAAGLVIALLLILRPTTSSSTSCPTPLPPSPPEVIRKYTFTLTKGIRFPDGISRLTVLINGQSPGPLIDANLNDWIEVTTINFMEEAASIHFHGQFQRGTNQYDGVSVVTQCPIPPGATSVYKFRAFPAGTFWYHAHHNSHYYEGMSGPLIVRRENEPTYDGEIMLMLSDWYHQHTLVLKQWYLSPNNTNGNEPIPDAALINGRGRYNCSALDPTTVYLSPALPSGNWKS